MISGGLEPALAAEPVVQLAEEAEPFRRLRAGSLHQVHRGLELVLEARQALGHAVDQLVALLAPAVQLLEQGLALRAGKSRCRAELLVLQVLVQQLREACPGVTPRMLLG